MLTRLVFPFVATFLFAQAVSVLSQPSQPKCCRYCNTGKACGDSCINKNDKCSKPKGCACDGSPPSTDKIGQNPECKGKSPNDFVSFRKSRSDQIGIALGLSPKKLDNVMGEKFEVASLASLRLIRNKKSVGKSGTDIGKAVPDALLDTTVTIAYKISRCPPKFKTETFIEPDSVIYEIKNTSGTLYPSKFSPQTERYLVYLGSIRQNPTRVPLSERDFLVPALIYVTTFDVKISPSLSKRATELGIALYHAKAEESCSMPYGKIKITDPSLVNPDIQSRSRSIVLPVLRINSDIILLR